MPLLRSLTAPDGRCAINMSLLPELAPTRAKIRVRSRAKAQGIIREKVERLGWSEGQLSQRPKSGPAKLARAARLRQETTLSRPRRLRAGCTREPARALMPTFIDGAKPTKPLNDSPDSSPSAFLPLCQALMRRSVS